MAKQQMYQQFIYKIHSQRILKLKDRNLIISVPEARNNREIISLADSNILRMIDTINEFNRKEAETQIKSIRNKIKTLRKGKKDKQTTIAIKKCYAQLDDIQCKTDYVAIIMDNSEDIKKLQEGFKINGIEYQRLIGTTNGVKKNTVVYSSVVNSNGKDMREDLTRRMENGRNSEIKLVPAKYEAYRALTCSASTPVDNPIDILVVDDIITYCEELVIKLDDSEDGEPRMVESDIPEKIEIDNSDGYGLILPSLSKKWADNTHVEYLPSGFCLRNSFCKGMVFTFDFQEFARRYGTIENDKCLIKDVWGKEHNVFNVDLILTTSMLKLWDSYSSIDSYLLNCDRNGYTFSVTKVCPETLENERNMNYQFLQSYELTDDEIEELIKPTIDEIKDILGGDVDKMTLFLKGSTTEDNLTLNDTEPVIQALMIDKNMAKDPYIINRVNFMIKKKINDAKIGVIKVHGNYAAISGDPFALCQHIFGLDIKNEEYGLLKAGQMYSKYWIEDNVDKVVCFRAPMSCHNNLRVMNITHNEDIDFWYQYMKTINIVNCHDSMAAALNGFDMD